MPHVTSLNSRDMLRQINAKISTALEPVAKEFGISIRIGRTLLGSTAATVKIEIATIGKGGQVMSLETIAFKRAAVLYGLKPEDLGRKFQYNGHTYTVRGLNTRSRKFPILVTSDDGRNYKFPEKIVAERLTASKEE